MYYETLIHEYRYETDMVHSFHSIHYIGSNGVIKSKEFYINKHSYRIARLSVPDNV